MTAIDCTAARQQMLVADLDELRGSGQTGLTVHLGSCAECRARAERLLQGHAAMATSLSALRPQGSEADVMPLRRRRRNYLWLPLPLAAAAVLALLLVGRSGSEALPNVDVLARLILKESPVVAPPEGKQALVIEKNNMTIVWLYNEERL